MADTAGCSPATLISVQEKKGEIKSANRTKRRERLVAEKRPHWRLPTASQIAVSLVNQIAVSLVNIVC